MLAVKCNMKGCVEHLLNAGANPFLTDQLGKEAKDYNVCSKHFDETAQVIDSLLADAKVKWVASHSEEEIKADFAEKDSFYERF